MTKNAYEDRLVRVIDHIYTHPDGDLSLDALADVAAMSRFHWHRVFHAMTGETCADAVRRIRLTRAALWLVDTDDPFEAIALRCGHSNARSFARMFTEAYGMTPRAFRDRGQHHAMVRPTPSGDLRMQEPVTITDYPDRTLAAIAHQGPYTDIGVAFTKLGAILGARNLWPQVEAMVGIYYDDPRSVAPEALRSHAAAIVSGPDAVPEGLDTISLPAGRHAVARITGDYSGLPAAWDRLYGGWLPDSSETPADSAPFEVYLNSPLDTAPEDLVTDICVPLAD